jgi:hypothetical protein
MGIKYVGVKSESWEREGKKKLEGGTKSQVQGGVSVKMNGLGLD